MIKQMIEQLKQYLIVLQRKHIPKNGLIPAAVILPIFYFRNEYHILFIKRTETVKVHKGQISFPGGHYEVTDNNMMNTALREFTEELGIPFEDVEILGQLDDSITTTSNYIISVFVGLISYPQYIKIDEREISRAIEVPISLLLDNKYQSETPEIYVNYPPPAYRFGKEVIWGATARILNQFLSIWQEISSNSTFKAWD